MNVFLTALISLATAIIALWVKSLLEVRKKAKSHSHLINKNRMDKSDLALVKESFKRYANTTFQIGNDLHFWNVFFNQQIENYVSNDIDVSRQAYAASYYVYDIPHDSKTGWAEALNVEMEKSIFDMYDWYKEFWGRTVNEYIGKAYNEMELVLLELIHITYFPIAVKPLRNRKYYSGINKEIADFLKANSLENDRSNNKHIIEFLRYMNPEFASFIKMPARPNLTSNWEDFFDFVSLLRNSRSHSRSTFTTDEINALKSKYREFIDLFLVLESLEKGYSVMTPKNHDNLWSIMNDFVANTVKFITGNNDLNFLR